MTIRTGKDQYNAIEEFRERTIGELKDPDGVIFKRDTEPPEHEVAYVREALRGHKKVLELGCGLGPWAAVAAGVGCEYTGVDPVAERIEYATAHVDVPAGTRFIHGDARTVKLLEGFDAVLLVTVIQHLLLPDAILALQNAAYHLIPGGEVILLESMIWDKTEEECDAAYAQPGHALHMIPKPLKVLQDAVPELIWNKAGREEDRWILTKVAE